MGQNFGEYYKVNYFLDCFFMFIIYMEYGNQMCLVVGLFNIFLIYCFVVLVS